MRVLVAAVWLMTTSVFTLPANADNVSAINVHFPEGARSASYSGTVRSYDTVKYTLGARAGQKMPVSFSPDNDSTYHNVIAPGADSATFTIGFRIDTVTRQAPIAPANDNKPVAAPKSDFADGYGGGPDFWRVAGISDGDALNLRSSPSADAPVVLKLATGAVVRNLGCRPVDAGRWCKVQLLGDSDEVGWVNGRFLREAETPPDPTSDALVAGTPYHATGRISCRFKGDASVTTCSFGVIRKGQGEADIDITFPDGFVRKLVFSNGKIVAPDGASVTIRRHDDNTNVTVNGTETFVIPDVIVGGS
ncbi:SH3 domain-containing protein [Aquabacter cavernae]|uniref:SH3 domain-containing protein n=1 Tax=Aquabacter cavernae TaxID=2496029 RepID=UPI000F8E5D62|nr:SH3 domain-containing protein [Aquabacter cavernae]